tara:strand:- start:33 stop:524 length:492 start_codon:yes stop_codon:yes gene_type:complete
MNEIIIATAGLSLALIIIGTGKTPHMLFSRLSKNKGISSSSNIEISLIENPKKAREQNRFLIDQAENEWKKPITSQERITLKKHLLKAITSNPKSRLKAIQAASLWGDPWVLPLLRKGLKDSDSRVVCAAAAAISKYKGKSTKSHKIKNQPTSRPPRNVALMR